MQKSPALEEFPLESQWGSLTEAARWRDILEKTGPENVRARLAQNQYGSASAIAIGTTANMTKGFAEEWLEWHDRRRREADEAFKAEQTRWTMMAARSAKWAAIAAAAAALAGMLQAFFAWRGLR